MTDPRNMPFEEWSRERWQEALAAIGWDLEGYALNARRPARSYAAVRDFPGIGSKRITAGDPRTLYTRCLATNATRATLDASNDDLVHAGKPPQWAQQQPPPAVISTEENPARVQVVRVVG